MLHVPMCFYVPGSTYLHSEAVWKESCYVCSFTAQTLEQVQVNHPTATLTTIEAAQDLIRSVLNSGSPVEIEQEDFDYVLEAMWPLHWIASGDSESFIQPESLYMGTGLWFVRIKNRYFKYKTAASLTHSDVVAKIQSFLNN